MSPGAHGGDDPVVAALRAAGCVFAEDEAALLRAASSCAVQLRTLLARRVGGEPLEHVLGWTLFCGLRVITAPGVFVPRTRSEFLVEQAETVTRPGGVVLDLCCGCGALGLALRSRVPGIDLVAADVDENAVRCARDNLGADAEVYRGDLFEALPTRLRGRVAVLMANVPYVPTAAIATMPREARDHEARIALDGGPDGLALARRLAADAGDWLAPGGHVLIEAGESQVPSALDLFAAHGLDAHAAHDPRREATVVLARRAATPQAPPGSPR